MNRKVPNVSFNLNDPYERGLYEFALTNGPFSKYVKRLIDRDRIGTPTVQIPLPVIAEEDAELANKKIAKAFI